MRRAGLLGASALLLIGLSGCPVTDDYYIQSAHPSLTGGADTSGAGTTGAVSNGGSAALGQAGKAQAGATGAQGGSAQAGSGGASAATAGDSSMVAAGSPDLGGTAAGGAPDAAGGAGGMAPCVPSSERCNGHDDNCNGSVDELVCNSSQNGTSSCFGFVLSEDSQHGYMLCTSKTRNYSQAKQACAGQDMRLVWLETADENNAVALKVEGLTNETDVLIGATDQVTEGYWFWDGGFQFWKGNQFGAPVNGSFTAWAQGNAPDTNNQGEDCGVIAPKTGIWNDRSCFADYPFLCEEKN
jgi:hypothetical protein